MSSIEEIIKFAIEQEIKAARRYERLAGQVENEETRDILIKMKEMEEEHRTKLENMDLKEFLNTENKPVVDLHFADEKRLSGKMKDLSPEDCLVMAAQFEEDARKLYLALADVCPVKSTARELFLRLAEEETHHKYKIESQLINSLKTGNFQS